MTRDEERLVQALEQSNALLTKAMPLAESDAVLHYEIAVQIEANETLIVQARQ